MKNIAVFLLYTLLLAAMAQAADWDWFDSYQTVDISADGWSAFYDMDLNLYNIENYYEYYGDYWAAYHIYYYDHWYGLYLYDYDFGAFSEWIWLINTY